MIRRLLVGAAAGAAGTTALHAATYLDMTLRGRPASSTPERTVAAMLASTGIQIPGEGTERLNRLTGLAALSGIATGVAVGVGYGILDLLRLRPPGVGGALVAGGGAMVLSNSAMARYGITHPTAWSVEDWVSDLVPHLVYGVVLSAAYAAARRPVPGLHD
jgi:hypothetical protein